MKTVKYDKESQALYIRVSEDKIEYSEELTDDIILDRGKDGALIGIDILNVALDDERKMLIKEIEANSWYEPGGEGGMNRCMSEEYWNTLTEGGKK